MPKKYLIKICSVIVILSFIAQNCVWADTDIAVRQNLQVPSSFADPARQARQFFEAKVLQMALSGMDLAERTTPLDIITPDNTFRLEIAFQDPGKRAEAEGLIIPGRLHAGIVGVQGSGPQPCEIVVNIAEPSVNIRTVDGGSGKDKISGAGFGPLMVAIAWLPYINDWLENKNNARKTKLFGNGLAGDMVRRMKQGEPIETELLMMAGFASEEELFAWSKKIAEKTVSRQIKYKFFPRALKTQDDAMVFAYEGSGVVHKKVFGPDEEVEERIGGFNFAATRMGGLDAPYFVKSDTEIYGELGESVNRDLIIRSGAMLISNYFDVLVKTWERGVFDPDQSIFNNAYFRGKLRCFDRDKAMDTLLACHIADQGDEDPFEEMVETFAYNRQYLQSISPAIATLFDEKLRQTTGLNVAGYYASPYKPAGLSGQLRKAVVGRYPARNGYRFVYPLVNMDVEKQIRRELSKKISANISSRRDLAKFREHSSLVSFNDLFRIGIMSEEQEVVLKKILFKYAISPDDPYREVMRDPDVPPLFKWLTHEVMIDHYIRSFYVKGEVNEGKRHVFGDDPGELEELTNIRTFFNIVLGQPGPMTALTKFLQRKKVNVLETNGTYPIFDAHFSPNHGINILSSCANIGGALVHETMALYGITDDLLNQIIEDIYVKWRNTGDLSEDDILTAKHYISSCVVRTIKDETRLAMTGFLDLGPGLICNGTMYWEEVERVEANNFAAPFVSTEEIDEFFQPRFITIEAAPPGYIDILDGSLNASGADDIDETFDHYQRLYEDASMARSEIYRRMPGVIETYVYGEPALRDRVEGYLISLFNKGNFQIDYVLLLLNAKIDARIAREKGKGLSKEDLFSPALKAAFLNAYRKDVAFDIFYRNHEEQVLTNKEEELKELALNAAILGRIGMYLGAKGYLHKYGISSEFNRRAFQLTVRYAKEVAMYYRNEMLHGGKAFELSLPAFATDFIDQYLEPSVSEIGREHEGLLTTVFLRRLHGVLKEARHATEAVRQWREFVVKTLLFGFDIAEAVFITRDGEEAYDEDIAAEARLRGVFAEYQKLKKAADDYAQRLRSMEEKLTKAALQESVSDRDWASFSGNGGQESNDPEPFHMVDITSEENIAGALQVSMESFIMSGKTLVVAVHKDMGGVDFDAERFTRAMDKWKAGMIKKYPRMERSLNDLAVVTYESGSDLETALEMRGIDPNSPQKNMIFAFTEALPEDIKDVSGIGPAVRAVCLNTDTGFTGFYYPLPEVVSLALTKELLGLSAGELLEEIKSSGVDLEDFNIAEIADDPGQGAYLIIKLIPRIERYRMDEHGDRYARLLRFLQSA